VSLRDVRLKGSYDSDSDSVLTDFYIPALSNSVQYKRLTGFFSSTTLAIAAKGIAKLISNKGRMKLVTGAKFRNADIEAIKEAYEDPESVIERTMLEELNSLENKFVEDHVRALGWMVAKQKLEIKVAIVYDENDVPLDQGNIEKRGIFHQKVGILEDKEGNKISFSGSDNETAAGWLDNIEEFKVFRSWIESEKEYFNADLNKFNKFWTGYPRRTKVIDIPTAVKEKLIEIAPRNFEHLNIDKWLKIKHDAIINLRDYQKDAVNSWLHNNKSGIIEMATGTGKTFVALGCLKEVLQEEKRLVVVISVPYIHLIEQWFAEVKKFGINMNVLTANSDKPNWENRLSDELLDIKNEISNQLLIFTTHATLSTERFSEIMKRVPTRSLLIVDEVHWIGAPKRKRGLLNEYDFRLGLSATPKRWFDPEGTEELYEYFEDVVFEFTLKNAIGKYLAQYEYKPHFIELTRSELESYVEETKKISKAYYSSRDNHERKRFFHLLCIKRQNIVKNAANKYNALRDILSEYQEIKHCLIYCSPQQINAIQDILNNRDIIQHKFTQIEGTKPEERYGSVSKRQFLLKEFASGSIDTLVAMKCLDEGVDIPTARLAIMMSNSGNPREYIQRRGRILRKHKTKHHATIHDIIVTPTTDVLNLKIGEIERKIFSRELMRYKEFSSIAINAIECLDKIGRLEEKIGLYG